MNIPGQGKITRRGFLRLAAAAPALLALPPFPPRAVADPPEFRPPNIILLLSDEIDFPYLGCYGSEFKTPNLDSLARDGMKFSNAYCTSPMCTPSRFSVLTGTYPSRCEDAFFREEFPETEPANIAWNSFVNADTRTLPRVLSQAGYVTGMAGKWHLGAHGPDWLEGLAGDADPSSPETQDLLRLRQKNIHDTLLRDSGFDEALSIVWANFDEDKVAALRRHNIPWITRGAAEFLDSHGRGDRPFFLYVAASAIHGPEHHAALESDPAITPEGTVPDVRRFSPDRKALLRQNEPLENWQRHQHTGMTELDHQTGVILAKLKELGIEDNTVVIYMPDHNIEPGKATCYEKGFRIPLIVKWPGVVPAGSGSDAWVQGCDLFSTIAAIAGIRGPAASAPDSIPFDKVLRDPSATGDRDFIYYESGYARGVRKGNFKYIAYRPPERVLKEMAEGKRDGCINYLNRKFQSHSQVAMMHFPGYFDQDQLYDLATDPHEQNNLAGDPRHAAELKELRNLLRKITQTFHNPFPLERIPFLESAAYRDLAAKQRARGTDDIDWLKRDHGSITWPPPPDNPPPLEGNGRIRLKSETRIP